jgi:hypothetical protein
MQAVLISSMSHTGGSQVSRPSASQPGQPYGPVAGVRCLPGGPVPRAEAAGKTHGFQGTNVSQLAVTVPAEVEGAFLRALRLDQRWVEAREQISLEIACVVAPTPAREVWRTAKWPVRAEHSVRPGRAG